MGIEKHDIVLSLNLTEFQRGIAQALIHLEAINGKAQEVARNVQRYFQGIDLNKSLNISGAAQKIEEDFGKAAKNVKSHLSTITQQTRQANQKIVKEFDFAETFGRNLQRGFEVGLAHAVGAISVGANPLVSLPHEIIRNVSIGIFRTFLAAAKDTGTATAALGAQAAKTGEHFEILGKKGERVSVFFNRIRQQSSTLADVLELVETKIILTGLAFAFVGKVVSKVGDVITEFAEGTARAAGEANLSFIQLMNILEAVGQSTGQNLGASEQWLSFIKELSITSGATRTELQDLGVSFAQIGAEAGLSGEELQKLLTVAAFTQTRFRNATEQATNLRQALAGNVRFLANNIPIGIRFADTVKIYAQALQDAGHSYEEARRIAESSSTAQVVLNALYKQSTPIIETALNTVGNYALELTKLRGALTNLQIEFGSTVEGVFARGTKALRDFVNELQNLPKPIQQLVFGFTTISGIALSLTGRLVKLAGITLIVIGAWKTLNNFLDFQIPRIGTLGEAFGKLIKFFGGSGKAVTSLGAGFAALGKIIGAFLIKFVAIAAIVAVVVEAFRRLEEQTKIVQFFIEEISSWFKVLGDAVKPITDEIEITRRAFALLELTINSVGFALSALVYTFVGGVAVIVIAMRTLVAGARLWNKAMGDTEGVERTTKRIIEFDKLLDRLEEKFDDVGKAGAVFGKKMLEAAADLGRLDWSFRRTLDAFDALDAEWKNLREGLQEAAFNDDQIKLLDRFADKLKRDVLNLQVRKIELIDGKSAAQQAKFLLELRDLALEINEKAKGKEFKILGGDVGKIEKATMATLLAELAKIDKQKAQSLKRDFDRGILLSEANEKLAEQKRLFDSIISSINKLEDTFNKDVYKIQRDIELQNAFSDAIAVSTNEFDRLADKAKQQNEIRRATLDIENKIKDVQDEIDLGKLEVRGGETIRIKLNETDKKKAEIELAKLTARKETIISIKIDEIAAKAVTDVLIESQKQNQAISKIFTEDAQKLRDQSKLQQDINKELEIGIEHAEVQADVRSKSIEYDNRIQELREGINDITRFLSDTELNLQDTQIQNLVLEQARKQALIDRLEIQKQYNTESLKENKLREIIITTNKAIKEQTLAFKEQLALLEARALLFSEGVLKGSFNKITEHINIVTTHLEEQLITILKLERLRAQNLPIDTRNLDEAREKLIQLKETLKALNFVKTIQDALNAISDAFEDVITNGVRGVLEGTQTIEQLFKNMAQNILLSFAKIAATNAMDQLRNKFNNLAETIANSDIGRKIAEMFGIKLDFLKNLGKPDLNTPEGKMLSAAQMFDLAVKKFAGAVGLEQGNAANVIGSTIDAATGYLKAPLDFKPTTEDMAQDFYDDFRDSFQSFTASAGQAIETGFFSLEGITKIFSDGFFNGLGGLLDKGFSFLFDTVSQLFTGGKGGGGIGGLLGSIISFFKFQHGGLVEGKGKKKDSVVAALTPGEFVMTPEAVQHYGTGFFKSLNNLDLSPKFLDGLNASSAPNRISGMAAQFQPVPVPQPVAVQTPPVYVTVEHHGPEISPKEFGMNEKDVTRVYVNGVKKDGIIRKTMRQDLASSRVR